MRAKCVGNIDVMVRYIIVSVLVKLSQKGRHTKSFTVIIQTHEFFSARLLKISSIVNCYFLKLN